MSGRIRSFDLARGLAILCVVVMHNTLVETYTPTAIWVGSLLHNMGTVGVPIFFFLAGYFSAFDEQQSLWIFMWRKVIRVLMPAWLWTIAFWILLGLTGTERDLDPRELPSRLLWLSNPSQYYYVFVLMSLYPVSYWARRLPLRICGRLALSMLTINMVVIAAYEVAIWCAEARGLPADPLYRNPLAWAGFFFYGLYVAHADRTLSDGVFGWISRYRATATLAAALLWMLSSAETYVLFPRQAPGGQDYFKLASFGYALIALHLVLLAARWLDQHELFIRPLTLLAEYAFFIYLIHLPLVPKIVTALTDRTILATMLLPKMLLSITLCLAIPILSAFLFRLAFSHLAMPRKIGRAFGVPI